MGFLISVVCNMAIADEVVCIESTSKPFQTFGFIIGLSDVIIGHTIYAVGNSLADLVANTSVPIRPTCTPAPTGLHPQLEDGLSRLQQASSPPTATALSFS